MSQNNNIQALTVGQSELNWLEAEINRREYSQKTSVQDFQKYSLEVMFHRSVVIDQTVDAIKLTKRKEPPKVVLGYLQMSPDQVV